MSQTFVTRLINLLEDRKTKEAVELFTAENSLAVEDSLSEIVSIASGHLTESNARSEQTLFECCKTILNIIAKTYNPKETVLEFLQYVECLDNDVRFYALLEPLGICMMGAMDNISIIEWTVSTIKSYVEDLPVPGEIDQEVISYRIINVLERIVLFLEPLVEEAAKINYELEETSLFGDYLLSLVITLCGKPFCYLNESIVETVTYKKLLHKIMALTVDLTEDIFYFLNIVSNRCRNIIRSKVQNEHTEDYMRSMLFELSHNVSDLAYANFYFYMITEEEVWKMAPQVYNPYYIFETCLYLFKILLSAKQEILVSNGLIFMEDIIKRIRPCSVPSDVLELKIYKDLFQLIIKVMIYSSVDTDRKKAMHIFQKYIEVFNMEARYSVISHLYEISEHSGVLSLIMGMFKTSIIECLNSIPRDPHFLGRNMELMLRKICKLPHGSTSDLVEISDEVITALNLLRFLLIRDKSNETGIWNMMDVIQRDYLKPLREGIDMCKIHWKIKAKDLELQRKGSSKNDDVGKDTEVTLTVGGERLPVMPIADKIAFCSQAINGLDIMESILIRVNECMDEYKAEQANECFTE
ncbi:glomulin isoform X1 [Harpegnathos saltator]|uniref:Glomulin n=1 Tax=Harpegnathos saltator TaxID=610380 RepID=E2BSH2_HARSA|nr:glomulin isoform X1 [Harpegnathos saltator]EFN81360.1 Glomulin [Harpegnathos saltator]